MKESTVKIVCKECGWTGYDSQMVEKDHPFLFSEKITACPDCFYIEDSLLVACDEPECWEPTTCGTSTKEGYRSTCSEHRP